jgi:hypothetical protein
LKGKSSIWIAQNVERKLRNFLGHKFWARGYFVSTVGRDEETIRTYIKNQEIADKQLDQLQLKTPTNTKPTDVDMIEGASSASIDADGANVTIGVPVMAAGFVHRIVLDLLF